MQNDVRTGAFMLVLVVAGLGSIVYLLFYQPDFLAEVMKGHFLATSMVFIIAISIVGGGSLVVINEEILPRIKKGRLS